MSEEETRTYYCSNGVGGRIIFRAGTNEVSRGGMPPENPLGQKSPPCVQCDYNVANLRISNSEGDEQK
jgi:hypothetical protein